MLKRSFNFTRADDKKSALSGYAFKYSEIADGWFGKERFDPKLRVQFNERCFLFRDHNPERLLARLGKNLEMKADDTGLFFRVTKLPDTDLAKDTMTLIKDEILSGASVGFRSVTERMENEIRVFEEIEVYEVSLVPRPYYQSSEVAARSKENLELKLKPPELIF